MIPPHPLHLGSKRPRQTSNDPSKLRIPHLEDPTNGMQDDRMCRWSQWRRPHFSQLQQIHHKGNMRHLCASPIKILALFFIVSQAFLSLDLSSHKNFGASLGLPRTIGAVASECTADSDCPSDDKICHENKCICVRDKPIEDQDRCLPLSLIGEVCSVTEQCMGNSRCLEGNCLCGHDAISLYNPSSKINYCHPYRRINEECNYDSQCPKNAYCSTKKNGCLCQNGYGPAIIDAGNGETSQCLPKTCSNSSSCESEYHVCEDDMCKCLATHFDPTTAKCYKFGSTGGKPSDELTDQSASRNGTASGEDENRLYTFIKDLTQNGDRKWLVILILISLSLLLLIAIVILLRRQYVNGLCWTVHKKEYEPNNKKQPAKSDQFNRDTIDNKSFRRKNGREIDSPEDDGTESGGGADESNLVGTNPEREGGNASFTNRALANCHQSPSNGGYVRVSISESHQQHIIGESPLKSSTSTPV